MSRRAFAVQVCGLSMFMAAQEPTSITSTSNFRSAPRISTLREFLQRNVDPDVVLVLEEGKEGSNGLQGLFQEEPLLEWGLQVKSLGVDDPIQKELREREGWPQGLRWVQLDAKGKVRSTGKAPGNGRDLADRLREGGFRPRIELLQDFLRLHPNRGDAWADLLNLQRSRADRLVRPLIKPPADLEIAEFPPMGVSELIHPLTEAEDERIFGPVADALRGHLGVEGWGESGSNWAYYWTMAEMHSPRLRDEARRLLPKVEAFLRSRPGHFPAWSIWTFLFPLADREPSVLLEELVAVPGTRTGLPPTITLDQIVRQLRRLERWGSIKSVVTPHWDRFRQETVILELKGPTYLYQWSTVFVGLLEAHLKLGERSRADELVRQAAEWSPPRPAWLQFIKVARDCHDEGLAAQWERLAPTHVKAP